MSETAELFRILSRLWQKYAAEGNFEAVIELAIASRALFRALPDGEGPEEAALAALHPAIEMIVFRGETPKKDAGPEPACSFCGGKPPEVRLGAGADVFICDGCVSGFAEIFRDSNGLEQKP